MGNGWYLNLTNTFISNYLSTTMKRQLKIITLILITMLVCIWFFSTPPKTMQQQLFEGLQDESIRNRLLTEKKQALESLEFQLNQKQNELSLQQMQHPDAPKSPKIKLLNAELQQLEFQISELKSQIDILNNPKDLAPKKPGK